MAWPSVLCRRLCFLFRRECFDRELDEEMRFHLERAREYPETNGEWRARLIPLEEARRMARGPFVNVLMVLSVAAGVVLLITCANFANLLLARGWKRGREMALRVSLGATRARLHTQLLTENLLLAISGGAAGWVLSVWVSEFLGRFFRPFRSGTEDVTDTRLLFFALAASILTGILFGLAPARQASRAHWRSRNL